MNRIRGGFPYLVGTMLWIAAVGLLGTAVWWLGELGLRSIPRTYSIPSGSSAPTLVPGDYVMASRNHYRDRAPQRGELIVFKLPRDNRTDYVKRLVGLPGDRVQIQGGILHINGAPVERELLTVRDVTGFSGRTNKTSEYLETLPNGRRYTILEDGDDWPYDNTREYLVPPGHYFLIGDNRDNSEDSRGTVGFVPRANLCDYPVVIFWSRDLDRIGTAVQPAP